jgi:7-keto-8-aminopelargonate synthetase-like enzyme
MSNSSATDLCSKVRENTTKFRNGMTSAGFTILGENHPICPVFLGDAKLASNFANLMMGEEIEEQFFSFSFTESLIMIENYQIK